MKSLNEEDGSVWGLVERSGNLVVSHRCLALHSSVAPGSCGACPIFSFPCQTLHEVSFGNQDMLLIQSSQPPADR